MLFIPLPAIPPHVISDMQAITCHPQFFTATILHWKHLLKQDKYKDIIIGSLRWLVVNKRVKVYSFVIMPNHLHLLWQMQAGFERPDVQRDVLKFTAQQIRFDMQVNHPGWLSAFEVKAKDRRYQFWERNPLSVDLYTEAVFLQKLACVHGNPQQLHWQLCDAAGDYRYSSARFYETGRDNWGFLTHYRE